MLFQFKTLKPNVISAVPDCRTTMENLMLYKSVPTSESKNKKNIEAFLQLEKLLHYRFP